MIKHIRVLLMAAALGAFSQPAVTAAALKVGDPAPKLEVGKWIQGDPVKSFERDKAYIVEFWATWCGPCRQTIPHLNETHKKYKDKGLVVIGQDVWEQDEDEVPKFVKQMGDKMTYRVALDDKTGNEKGKMAANWMEAAGQGGIPTAFVVGKDGNIAWIGHPMELKDKTLDEILAGTFDVKKAAAEAELKKAKEEKTNAVWQKFQKAAGDKDWTTAEGHLNEMEQLLDEDERGNLDMVRLRFNLRKGDAAGATVVASRLAAKDLENPQYHNQLAWILATEAKDAKPMLEIAEKSAKLANDLSKGNDPEILDTVARIQFVMGQKEAAVATQQKAVNAAEAKAKKDYQKTLDSYKAGKIPGE